MAQGKYRTHPGTLDFIKAYIRKLFLSETMTSRPTDKNHDRKPDRKYMYLLYSGERSVANAPACLFVQDASIADLRKKVSEKMQIKDDDRIRLVYRCM